jgi:hypothetical protein
MVLLRLKSTRLTISRWDQKKKWVYRVNQSNTNKYLGDLLEKLKHQSQQSGFKIKSKQRSKNLTKT